MQLLGTVHTLWVVAVVIVALMGQSPQAAFVGGNGEETGLLGEALADLGCQCVQFLPRVDTC